YVSVAVVLPARLNAGETIDQSAFAMYVLYAAFVRKRCVPPIVSVVVSMDQPEPVFFTKVQPVAPLSAPSLMSVTGPLATVVNELVAEEAALPQAFFATTRQ